jgi:hypothetical protein
MTASERTIPAGVAAVQRLGMAAGALGVVGCAVGLFLQPAQFFRSYLFGFLFWAFLAFGATALLMIQHLSGGMWGLVNRRMLEAASRTAPVVALLFIPVALGISSIYSWAHPQEVPEIVRLKLGYLNAPFFTLRAAVYFFLWMVVTFFLNKWSLQQDREPSAALSYRLENLSGAGLVLVALVATFASIDWAMSLSPEWFSTIYGVLFIVGGILSAWSFAILLIAVWGGDPPFDRVSSPGFIQDMGKFLLAFVMLWAYMHLSQFLITWSGNLPEEIPWYLKRMRGPYLYLGQALVLFHFALPFMILLSRDIKRVRKQLAMVAGLVFVMRAFELLWVIGPQIHEGVVVHWLDVAAWAAVGGIWVWFFTQQLRNRPMLPLGEPDIRELLDAAEAEAPAR